VAILEYMILLVSAAFLIALIAGPSIGMFLVYRSLKRYGKTKGGISFALFLLTVFTTIGLIIKVIVSPSGFGPDYDSAKIKQNIGGTLMCRSVFTADIHDWQHDVSYDYVPADSNRAVYIGSGTYYNRPWEKNEQLVRYRDWLILKTGGMGDFDRVIIGDVKTNQWKEYDFSEESIVSDQLWMKMNPQPRSQRCCSKSFVTNIANGLIHVHYKFTRPEPNEGSYGHKDIVYIIDEQTGQLVMTKIQ